MSRFYPENQTPSRENQNVPFFSLLKREPSKQSLTTKRLMAGWDDDYLFRILLAAGGG